MAEKNKSKISQNQLTFESFDKLNLKSFGEDLFQVLEKGLSSSIGEMGEKKGWTLSLNAVFGNGKTTFLKMFEHFIKTEKQGYDVLFVNAWESDFYKEPVIAILSEFVSWIEQGACQDKGKKKNIISNINKIVGIIGNIGISAGNQWLKQATGLDIKETAKEVMAKGNINDSKDSSKSGKRNHESFAQEREINLLGQNLLSAFKQRKKAVNIVRQEVFSEYTADSGKKLLVIVDELDRARPDHAVRFLEDMKHFFDIENVIFLVAVNREQMEAAAKGLYGQGLDFNGYYRKFFKQEMDLPDPRREAQRFVDSLIKKTRARFFQKNNGTKTDPIDRRDRVRNIYLSCKMFNLTLREIENFVRIFEMILGHKKSIIKWDYMDACSFFICLFLKEKTLFQNILDKKFSLDDFLNFADKKKSNDNLYENYLLAQAASLFIQLKSDNLEDARDTEQILQEETDKISNAFPNIPPGTIDYLTSPMERFHLGDAQPALKICATIKRCQSAFDQ